MKFPFFVLGILSFERELKYFTGFFFGFLLLVIFSVIVLTQAGIELVSNQLVNIDEVTGVVQVLDPTTGSVYKEVSGPFVWPIVGPITLEFGQSSLYQVFHTGIDIDGQTGDPITVFYPGTVMYTGEISWGYGRHVIVDHGDNIISIYAHLNSWRVSVGDQVSPGDVIGTMGSTGWSTGSHLHFQINVFGIPVNPRTFLGY